MKTLVIGASVNPARYSYKAINFLLDHKHEVVALSNRTGEVRGVEFETEKRNFQDIDTVTLYINPIIQEQYYDYIIGLHPRRVIFNPGTENAIFAEKLREHDILPETACTLVLLNTGQY